MPVRPFADADAPRLCEIFYRSIHEVASAKYDQAQVNAWAPQVPDAEKWLPRLREYHTFVASAAGGEIVGWTAMTNEGYIDMLFCLPEATRSGVASDLYAAVERTARELGITRLSAHASLLAQPFFAKHGWLVDKHEVVERNGVGLPRAEMSKAL